MGHAIVLGRFARDFSIEQFYYPELDVASQYFITKIDWFGPAIPGPLVEIDPYNIYEAEVHVFIHPEDIVTTLIDSQGDKMSTDEIYILGITSDEPLTSKGDETTDDIVFKDCQVMGLRPELGYNSNGRVYTLYMGATDKYGVTGTWEAEVHIPLKGEKEAKKDESEYKVEVCPDGLPAGPKPVITTSDILWSVTKDYGELQLHDVVDEVIDSNGKEMDVNDVAIASVSSDEKVSSEKGDVIMENCHQVYLFQDALNENGRVYTLNLTVTDDLGNTGTAEAKIHVTESGKDFATDDGPVYSVDVCPPEESQKAKGRSQNEWPSLSQGKNSTALSAYPNPFNPQTTVQLSVASRQEVTLQVFDMLGREVALLYRGQLEGNHQFSFDASSLPSGAYLIRVQGERFVQTQRITFVK